MSFLYKCNKCGSVLEIESNTNNKDLLQCLNCDSTDISKMFDDFFIHKKNEPACDSCNFKKGLCDLSGQESCCINKK